jgi:quercetin 2,3-dioxygenase
MKTSRKIARALSARPTIEGAGVRLKRVFGYSEVPLFDPFLMLDYFGSSNPDDYMAGFPWHPHRGIETVTYMLEGAVEHGDSLGNSGVIHTGDIQWMTAGSGIIHQEMPKRTAGAMWGLQLWVNLPKDKKMMDPRYRDIKASEVPSLELDDGATVKVIAGTYRDSAGAAQDLVGDPQYLDIAIPANGRFQHHVEASHTVFAFILSGDGYFGPSREEAGVEQCVLFGPGEVAEMEATTGGLHFILVSGAPFREPVAWRGPIVMNTRQELDTAFGELNAGTFIKHR